MKKSFSYGKMIMGMLLASTFLFGILVLTIQLDGPIETVSASIPTVTSEVVMEIPIIPDIASLLPTATADCGEAEHVIPIATIDPLGYRCTWKSGNELPNQRYCGKISRTFTENGTNYVCCVVDCVHNFFQCSDGTVHDALGGSCGPLHSEVCYPANN
ncbi:MAG: hypothetical protein UR14_C0010G0003 [candidate division TM6 bacterium GW2011_GWE2_31_21]|nr:MAG: hypothetical protein UR14_C0010G0003 [candidate division TM6 bacterium GW2011_GWE2_31_21]